MKRAETNILVTMLALTAEAKLDAEVETHQIGAILVLTRDVNVELAGRDLSRQSDGVLEFVLAGGEGTLKIGVVGSCFLADIESTGQKTNETKLDDNIGKCTVLRGANFGRNQ